MASLSLRWNPAPNRYFYSAYLFSVAHHPLSRLQSSVREAPYIVPHEVQLASTLLIGIFSRLQNGTQRLLTGRLCSISAWHFAR